MATVMKGLRTPRGDAGGGVYRGEGKVMVRRMRWGGGGGSEIES